MLADLFCLWNDLWIKSKLKWEEVQVLIVIWDRTPFKSSNWRWCYCHGPVPSRLTLYGYKCFCCAASLSLPCTALYRGGVMTAPAPGSDTCKQSSHSLLKAAAESASSLDYCVTLDSRQPEDRRWWAKARVRATWASVDFVHSPLLPVPVLPGDPLPVPPHLYIFAPGVCVCK